MGAENISKKSTKRQRTKYTPEQLEILEDTFIKTQYPDSLTMEDLGDRLGISTDKVSVWFQNRRSKFKKMSKDSQVTWMRQQVFDQENRRQSQIVPDDIARPSHTRQQRHVLSAFDGNRNISPDIKTPISNLHYKPNGSELPSTTCLPWENNYRYTTPSPTFQTTSCANDILKDDNINRTTVRPEYPADVQFYGQHSPQGFWSTYMSNQSPAMPVLHPTMYASYPLFSQTGMNDQRLTVL